MSDYYPLGNPLVPYGTPLHVTELFLRILKMTFMEFPEDHPFRYVEDDFEKTGIGFDVSLNKEGGIYGKKPLIVVSRGPQNTTPSMMGDLASAHLPSGFSRGSGLYSSSIDARILSRAKAEVEIIGQHVFSFMMMCRTHLPRYLGMHMAQSVMLSEVNRMDDDDAMFMAQATLTYVGQYIWNQERDDPLLRSVGVVIDKMKQDKSEKE